MNRMLRMKIQDGGRRDGALRIQIRLYRRKKSGYAFGHNETLLLISLYQKYEVFFSDVSYKKKAGPGPRISTSVFLCRQSELFLAFRTNHSNSRIVDKKMRPELRTNVRFLALINVSSRYWLPFHANECVFSRNEQRKVYY